LREFIDAQKVDATAARRFPEEMTTRWSALLHWFFGQSLATLDGTTAKLTRTVPFCRSSLAIHCFAAPAIPGSQEAR
jgi:hypothetical protein